MAKTLPTEAVLHFIQLSVFQDQLAVMPAKCPRTGEDIRVLVMTRPSNDPNGGLAAFPLATLIEGDPMQAFIPTNGCSVVAADVQEDGTVNVIPAH